MAELTGTVHVYDEDGVVRVFGPGDTVPAWAAKKITNPKLWDTVGGTVQKPTAALVGEPGPEGVIPIPPKSGPKGTVDAWKAYAAENNVNVADDATRKDIVATLNARGIATE